MKEQEAGSAPPRVVRRILPCSCGFDLRGRVVGERCPECGWLIDAPGPAWCTAKSLLLLRSKASLARVPCLALLAVPTVLVLGLLGRGDRAWFVALVLFAVLMPLQLLTQLMAMWSIATVEVGARRARTLRVCAVVRVAAFIVGAIAVVIGLNSEAGPATVTLGAVLYSVIPLVAIASDFMTLRTLGSLHSESRVLLSGSHAVLPPVARWSLIAIYVLLLIPFVGWFFGPILWAVAMSIGFAQVGAVAEEARKTLLE
ncbi:MAG: hypothetical protein ACO3QC_05935 [Phycisphaerales bacterium]